MTLHNDEHEYNDNIIHELVEQQAKLSAEIRKTNLGISHEMARFNGILILEIKLLTDRIDALMCATAQMQNQLNNTIAPSRAWPNRPLTQPESSSESSVKNYLVKKTMG